MQHGGAFAVALFFMVSGFIIVAVATRESRRSFAVRRALRIFPPLWASIFLVLAVYIGVRALFDYPRLDRFAVDRVLDSPNPVSQVLLSMSLLNYIVGTSPVNGVAWTLIIEVMFYVIVLALLPWYRDRPATAVVATWLGLAVIHALAKINGIMLMIAVNSIYATYLFLGTLVFLRYSGRIGTRFFAVATGMFWALFIVGVERHVAQAPWTTQGYGVSYALAWLVFVGLLLVDRHITLGPVTAFFSRISYSLYLNHGAVGVVTLTLLTPLTGFPLALALAFIVAVCASAIAYRWIERPSQDLGRRVGRKLDAASAPLTPATQPR
jgi:peptidoglycan/LPS O-acetylase OafA/YrhL